MSDHIINAIDDSQRGLRVQFFRSLDRLAHTISLVERERVLPLLRSREGTDLQEFPPSPPMQQIAIQEMAQHEVALLVGMAGRSHWSASVESDPAQRRFYFDIACRVNPSGQMSLASTYDVLDTSLTEAGAGEIHFQNGESRSVLRSVAVGSESASPIVLQQNQIEIRPVATRWAYELILL